MNPQDPTKRRQIDAAILAEARARLLPPVETALQEVLSRRGAALAGWLPGPVGQLAPNAPGHYGMMRYHLGWLDEHLAPVAAPTGKRLRPLLCLLACEACGGVAERAVPAAVALELLHNFSLIHDDIEDGDAMRHHRPTVWKLWGEPQAINAGDGMHILAYLALLPLAEQGVPPAVVLRLIGQLAETSLIITEGQHLDLAFERRDDVSPSEYLDMIGRKSAALLGCSAAAGAEIAGADAGLVEALASCGHQLGLAFQIRDDVLGIWGESETTGKPAGDLHRRKKSLPVLYAMQRADEVDRRVLRSLFAAPEPSDADVARTLEALNRTGARRHCEQMVARYSASARDHVGQLSPSPARDALEALAVQLETREA
ncbi:MAG: polyprenyl synthetase family protein [Chloroflexota bacterium]